MAVSEKHPSYLRNAERWRTVRDWLSEQDTIHGAGTKYLPMTTGMGKATNKDELYNAYLKRARASGITRSALSGIMGLVFKKEPITNDNITPVTNNGLDVVTLARDVTRAVASLGRCILVVDAPTEGGTPYITMYQPESLINWKVDQTNNYRFTLCVFEEEISTGDEFEHDTEVQYRVYRKTEEGCTVQLYNKDELPVNEPVYLQVSELPVFAIGSIDTSPECDPIPLYPVAMCALAAYQISADLRQDLYLSGQRQLWMSGCDEKQFQANIASGYGAGSAWYLGSEEGTAGFIESNGNSYAEMSAEREHELRQAEQYAVKITQSDDSNESGKALQIRASAQHASIYTIADSITIGINRALDAIREWNGSSPVTEFELQTEYTEAYASEQMLRALNDAIDSQNAPRSAMFELIRKTGLSTAENEEMEREINEQVPPLL
jgi:hypothetical protein